MQKERRRRDGKWPGVSESEPPATFRRPFGFGIEVKSINLKDSKSLGVLSLSWINTYRFSTGLRLDPEGYLAFEVG